LSTNQEMTIRHQNGEYAVRFLSFREIVAALPSGCRVVTDDNVFRAWGRFFGPELVVLRVPPGERSKCLRTYGRVIDWLAETGTDRLTSLAAVGGGVIGDLAGFAAATYMRGIPLIQVPTTLLAQVDSAIGGKVGINLVQGKNLLGSFYPPKAIYMASETLQTITPRHFRNGMAEVCKYGFVLDQHLARVLAGERLKPHAGNLGEIVRRCVLLKKSVVEVDELDKTGARAVLNFGHTVGHAIERAGGYRMRTHGEAISIGMAVEAELGERLGITEPGTAQEVRSVLRKQGLRTGLADWFDVAGLIALMRMDKKAERGQLGFSLLTKIGECKLVRNVPVSEVESALRSK
jgi:3-dehydroquinate synthase